MSALRALACSCEFGDNLNERLRDQLVIGINQPQWQQEIILKYTTNDATLAQIETYAVQLEQASLHAKKLAIVPFLNADNSNVCRINKKYSVQPRNSSEHEGEGKGTRNIDVSKQCIFCGYYTHKNNRECPARGKTCSACGKRNHFAQVCIGSGRARVSAAIRSVRHDCDYCEQQENGRGSKNPSPSNMSQVRQIRS